MCMNAFSGHLKCLSRDLHMRKWLFSIFALILLNASNAHAEEPLEFVKRYITKISKTSAPEYYSKFWREKVRKHLHNTSEKLQKEFGASVEMHEYFLRNGSIESSPQVSSWEGQANVISYPIS